jgi:hypothetical protein
VIHQTIVMLSPQACHVPDWADVAAQALQREASAADLPASQQPIAAPSPATYVQPVWFANVPLTSVLANPKPPTHTAPPLKPPALGA